MGLLSTFGLCELKWAIGPAVLSDVGNRGSDEDPANAEYEV